MTTPELPPLHIPTPKDVRGDGLVLVQREALERAKRAAKDRERILLDRIAELEADAERLDSGRIVFTTRDVYGEPARVTFAGVDLRAAIDAARKA